MSASATATLPDALPPLATGPHRRTFDRLAQLLDASPTPERGWGADVLTATFGVFARGAAQDFERTAMLARVDRQRVVAILASYDDLLKNGAQRPITTATILALTRTGRIRRVLAVAGYSELDVDLIATECAEVGFWLLISGVDGTDPAPLPRSAADLDAIVDKHGVNTWRQVLAIIAADPWSPAAHRLIQLGQESRVAGLGQALEACARVYRKRREDEERHAIAREIRRLVALSGCSQRQFAAHIGTSASRLSTYVNALVTPSATLMLRIQRVAAELARAADAQP